jgi:hypothetical protein
MVAHFTATPYCLVASAESMVIWSLVRVAVLDPEVVILQVDVEIGQDQRSLMKRPDDPGHLVAVQLDDGVGYLDASPRPKPAARHPDSPMRSNRRLRARS